MEGGASARLRRFDDLVPLLCREPFDDQQPVQGLLRMRPLPARRPACDRPDRLVHGRSRPHGTTVGGVGGHDPSVSTEAAGNSSRSRRLSTAREAPPHKPWACTGGATVTPPPPERSTVLSV